MPHKRNARRLAKALSVELDALELGAEPKSDG